MGVDSKHPQYEKWLGTWQKCRDAFEGSEAIKEAGTRYLPQLTKQSDSEYEAYKERALWFGATARTVQGFTGALFRNEPEVEVPSSIEDQLQDVTLSDVPLDMLIQKTVAEVLKIGRYGLLIDRSPDEGDNSPPYITQYRAEDIWNWREESRNGDTVLTLVVLSETHQDPVDAFASKDIPQLRVLFLDELGVYQGQIWRKLDKDGEYEHIQDLDFTPIRGGQPLTFIPFHFVGPTTNQAKVEKSPILDLVEINLSHYRSSADLEHGRHFTALPQFWLAGFREDKGKDSITIGSTRAWTTTNPDARAGILEFTGQGLGALENALEQKERLMAVIGARLLEEQKRAAEAADTVRIRQAGEVSVLQALSISVSRVMTKVIKDYGWWSGEADTPESVEASIQINKKFFDTPMDPRMLEALIAALQARTISESTFLHNLSRGEILPEDRTIEEEIEMIRADIPAVEI